MGAEWLNLFSTGDR